MKNNNRDKTWDFDKYADEYDSWILDEIEEFKGYSITLNRAIEIANISEGQNILDRLKIFQ